MAWTPDSPPADGGYWRKDFSKSKRERGSSTVTCASKRYVICDVCTWFVICDVCEWSLSFVMWWLSLRWTNHKYIYVVCTHAVSSLDNVERAVRGSCIFVGTRALAGACRYHMRVRHHCCDAWRMWMSYASPSFEDDGCISWRLWISYASTSSLL